MGIQVEQVGKTVTVRLQDSIDISSAEELKKVLVDALKVGEEIRVHWGEATYLDVTGVQLLWAGECEARNLDVKWVFVDPLPEAVRSILHDAGFKDSFFVAGAPQPSGEAA